MNRPVVGLQGGDDVDETGCLAGTIVDISVEHDLVVLRKRPKRDGVPLTRPSAVRRNARAAVDAYLEVSTSLLILKGHLP